MKIRMIKYFAIICMLSLTSFQGYAQSGFVFHYSTLNDEHPNDIIETSDGGFIITVSIGTYPAPYQTLLIRLNKYGDTMVTRYISLIPGTCNINKIIKLDNGTFTGIGSKHISTGEARLWLLTITDSLSIISDTNYHTDFNIIGTLFGFLDHFHNLIVCGSACPSGSSYNEHPFVFKFSQSSDSLFSHYYTNPFEQYAFSMIEKPDTTGYLMSIWGKYYTQTNSPSQFLTMDYSFNVLHIDSVPGRLDLYLNTKKINDHELFVTGKRWFDNIQPQTDKLGILKIDSACHIKAEQFLGPDDTVSYPAYNTNLDFLNTQNIFLGGILNQDWGGIFSYNFSYILLSKFDSSLNLTWLKYFGGDQYYMVWSVIATTDGGCIIGASNNDYSTMGEQRDVYILKVDSNGLITGIHQPPTNNGNKTLVYPNPGQDLLNLETQQENLVFHLYDIMGMEVCNKYLIPGQNVLQIQNLNSGIYIYKIVKNSQMIECGKWIKE